jgi:hypothetical protein
LRVYINDVVFGGANSSPGLYMYILNEDLSLQSKKDYDTTAPNYDAS